MLNYLAAPKFRLKSFKVHVAQKMNHFDLSCLRAELRPFRLHFFPTLKSTNLHAAAMRKAGRLYAPAIVLTAKQSAGRGRGSNTWFSSAGSLTVTFVLPIDSHEPQELPLIAGLAARAACAEMSGCEEVMLKWPNDLLVGDKKLAGLLCQRVEKVDLVGIGINVNTPLSKAPAMLRRQIISLQLLAGRELNVSEVLISLSRHLRQLLRLRNEKSFATFVEEFGRYDALAGRQIEVIGENGDPPISGIGQGIDSAGRLLLRSGTKTHRIIAGHIIMA
ncbi:MAG TPA: biotin--[acetyl-CoA-carboxylase] ligase [Candidatus Kapabacteria bacterium]|jgi:BirA family biotin operon repressor/biotin-[acetyl-CoA-carboxylase] ligase